MQLCGKVTDLLSSLGEEPETFTGRILFMSMFNDISCDGKGNEEECVANSKVVSILAKDTQIVLSEIKAEVSLENDIPSHQNLLLQRYEERIELLSQENKVSKFCMDAGFIHVVEIGQYFMTKDTEEQFFARACREYTLPRNDESSQPDGFRETQESDPYWKSRPVICTVNMELKSESGL